MHGGHNKHATNSEPIWQNKMTSLAGGIAIGRSWATPSEPLRASRALQHGSLKRQHRLVCYIVLAAGLWDEMEAKVAMTVVRTFL